MISGEEKYVVQMTMRKYGLGFVKWLGQALSWADHINAMKIKTTWPEYWDQYFEMGKKEFHEDLQ